MHINDYPVISHRLEPTELQFVIREEHDDELDAIDAVTQDAFRAHPFSRQTEHLIVNGLRNAGALSLSLVATVGRDVIGHAAFSPVSIEGAAGGWWGLRPVAVAPGRQRSGVGSALIRSGPRRLAEWGVAGCVVLGDPGYYRRLGFRSAADLRFPGAPADHFMAWAADGGLPAGQVTYHAAFDGESRPARSAPPASGR